MVYHRLPIRPARNLRGAPVGRLMNAKTKEISEMVRALREEKKLAEESREMQSRQNSRFFEAINEIRLKTNGKTDWKASLTGE